MKKTLDKEQRRLKEEYFERTIHDPSFDTEEGRWDWILKNLVQSNKRMMDNTLEEVMKKFTQYPDGWTDKYCDYNDENEWGCDYERWLRDVIQSLKNTTNHD